LLPLLRTHTAKSANQTTLPTQRPEKGDHIPNLRVSLLILRISANGPGKLSPSAGERAPLVGALPNREAVARHALVAGTREVVAVAVVGAVLRPGVISERIKYGGVFALDGRPQGIWGGVTTYDDSGIVDTVDQVDALAALDDGAEGGWCSHGTGEGAADESGDCDEVGTVHCGRFG